MKQNLNAVHEAAEDRDLSALTSAIDALSAEVGTDEAQALMRSHVLPRLTLKGLLWFWRQLSSPVQQYQLLTHMSNTTTKQLLKGGFEFGRDFSFTEGDDGTHRLMLNANAKKHLELVLSTDRLVSLALLTKHKHVTS